MASALLHLDGDSEKKLFMALSCACYFLTGVDPPEHTSHEFYGIWRVN